VIVGLLHPGEMGAAVGRVLQSNGHEVVWASAGRSEATRERAQTFRDAGTVRELAEQVESILSICPPHAALDVARAVGDFAGVYVDANAISPMRAQEVAAIRPRFVDGGIVGGPPDEPGTTLYLSGSGAASVAVLFVGSRLEPRVVADHFGVEDEWRLAAPELAERLPRAEHSAATKGWRWSGEMEEIADTFAAAGQPDGFHRAAARVYRS
jgi:hypothetical protein